MGYSMHPQIHANGTSYMSDKQSIEPISLAEVVLPATNLSETQQFFIDHLGFQLDSIAPADDPVVAQLSGHGLRLRIDTTYQGAPGTIRLGLGTNSIKPSITAPNGTQVDFGPAIQPLAMPELKPSICVQQFSLEGDEWKIGRAGMYYRDLIPDRQGGRFIASHIRIPEGGPVPDNVHYHDIHFQIIYCYRGWVRLVYEDQGEPFVMQAGDCVLQPPLIRHRVLESSDGLEVIEIGSPATHMTYLDHEMTLPTGQYSAERDFSGQQYTFHHSNHANWERHETQAFDVRDLGIAKATHGMVSAHVNRYVIAKTSKIMPTIQDKLFAFSFVLQGQLSLSIDQQQPLTLSTGDSFVIPQHMQQHLTNCSNDLEILSIYLLKEPLI